MHPVERFLSIIAPDECLHCQKEGSVLCYECADSISALPSICYGCGKASVASAACPKCRGKYRPQHVWIAAEYKSQAKKLARACKFEHKRPAAQVMAEMLNDSLPYFAEPPLVAYVPTASSRRRERGFDQAQLIAQHLSKTRGWKCVTVIARVHNIRQLGADRETRKRQLASAFRSVNPSLIKDRHILLVDDVVTTGATIEACAKELKKAGAARVDAAVFARTPNK